MISRLIGAERVSSSDHASRASRPWVSYQAIGFVVGALEVALITVGSLAGEAAYDRIASIGLVEVNTALGLGILASVLYVSVARSAGLYRLTPLIYPAEHMRRIMAVCGIVLLSLTAILFLLKVGSDISRGALMGFAALMLFLCCMARIAASTVIDSLLSQHAIAGRPAFLIGDADELAQLSSSYLLRHFGIREVGRLPLHESGAVPGNAWQPAIDSALETARRGRAKEFIVATKLDRLDRLNLIRDSLRVSPLAVKLIPNRVLRSVIDYQSGIGETRDHLIELQRAPMRLPEQIAKRALDITVASAALLLVLPIFVIVVCAIKLDSPGPVIFRQRRNGFDQHPFTIFKFRSMTVLEDGQAIVQAKRGDRRVTRVGQFLRKSSIDELPQLFNVLRGDMSIVGPRPHAIAHDVEYKSIIGGYCFRHHVKPGITGWAQVNGCRGETAHSDAMKKRVDLDIWYVNNRSVILDLQILVRTCLEVFGHEAY